MKEGEAVHAKHTRRARNKRAFTLIEMMISVLIFSAVMLVATTSYTTFLKGFRKSRTESVAVDSVSAALDLMARLVRRGSTYQCDGGSCVEGVTYSSLSVLDQDGTTRIKFQKSGNALQRCVGTSACDTLTPPTVTINALSFERGTSLPTANTGLPFFIIRLSVTSGKSTAEQSNFNIQTSVGQRLNFAVTGQEGHDTDLLIPNTTGNPGPSTFNPRYTDGCTAADPCKLQDILNNNGFSSINAATDQSGIQYWTPKNTDDIVLTITFISGHGDFAASGHVFKWYKNGSISPLTPIFKDSNSPSHPTLQILNEGESMTYTIPGGSFSTMGFALFTENPKTGKNTSIFVNQASLNSSGVNQVVVYNPSPGKYIMGFEDLELPSGDRDFQDFVVMVQVGSGGSNAVESNLTQEEF